MIYNSKEYKVIPREGARIGDLVQVTAIGENDVVCDIHAFITKFDGDGDIHIENVLPDGTNFVNDEDTFKTYKYVKDVEETTRFSVGDTVKIVGMSIEGYGEHIGNNAAVVRIFSGGDVRVSNKIGENNYMDNIYPPSSLELIEKQRQPIAEELSQTVESNVTTLAEATRDKLNEVAEGKVSTKKIAVFAVVEYSFSHQGLVNKKEVDRHGTLDRATAVSEGLNERNRKCFYSVDGILA